MQQAIDDRTDIVNVLKSQENMSPTSLEVGFPSPAGLCKTYGT